MIKSETIPGLPEKAEFSYEEKCRITENLMRLIKNQTERYNGIDSSSISAEKLHELAKSALYTLSTVSDDGPKSLLKNDLEEMLVYGQNVLNKKCRMLKSKWSVLKSRMPKTENVYYNDTVKNISIFFKNYDVYYAAHEIPCSIDYPLMRPVSEQLLGVSYIDEYIRTLSIESAFINRFEKNRVTGLYNRLFDDYAETPANLCEPVFTAALAPAVLRKSKDEITTLIIEKEDINRLYGIFAEKSKKQIETELEKSTKLLCNALDMQNNSANYFVKAARHLAARVYTAVRCESLDNIFVGTSL